MGGPLLAVLAAVAVPLVLPTLQSDAGPDKIKFPADYKAGVLYATVNRHDMGTPLRTDFLLKGQSAALTFKEPGVFDYNCALHPNMKGTVEVRR